MEEKKNIQQNQKCDSNQIVVGCIVIWIRNDNYNEKHV